MDKKKIGAGFAGALQKAADAAKLAKLTVQDMTADAKQSRGKKAQQKADAQKVPASKDEPTAVEPPENAAPEIPCIATRNALQIIYYLMAADVLQDGVEDAILSSNVVADTFITPKLLVWDLLTIAYSDESYDERERKLLKYIVRKLGVDKAVFLEMESSMLTILDIEKEIAWIKTTDQPYLTIEARINELTKRKAVIFESVKDLITL